MICTNFCQTKAQIGYSILVIPWVVDTKLKLGQRYHEINSGGPVDMLVGEMDMVALCAYINTGHGTGQCILDQKSRYKLSHGTHQEF